MPKINFSTRLFNLKGEVLQENGEEMTAGYVAASALLAPESQDNGARKAQRYRLAVKVNDGGEQELKAEDVVLIKEVAGKFCPPLICGQMFDLLDA